MQPHGQGRRRARQAHRLRVCVASHHQAGAVQYPLAMGAQDRGVDRGRAPEVGEHFVLQGAAKTLRLVARSRGEDFYRGEIAAAIARFAAAGFNRIYIHQIGPDQDGFFRFYERHILPRFARSADEEGSRWTTMTTPSTNTRSAARAAAHG
ncbi:MAG: gamma-glutamyltransferase, partial [Dehalococcoidia bacterium]|nr:gamma-glutamyltransferase [Dehalococcoidia bacterium]